MSVRIFSCGNNLDNLNICIKERVIGFRHMFSEDIQNDTVYIVIKKDGVSHCCARAIISHETDYVPWEQPELYVLCHRIENIEYCNPFSLTFLRDAEAGNSWGAVYIRGSHAIKDEIALKMLTENFIKNFSSVFYIFSELEVCPPKKKRGRKKLVNINALVDTNVEMDLEDCMGADDSSKIHIMGTFKTIKFRNETDNNRGLEPLVNNNFYNLFKTFQEENSILIPENRLFLTKAKEKGNGVCGIPDAVLISFDKDDIKSNIKINIIEYECYGEGKSNYIDKFNYLNGIVIPQLIRFASAFSIVTDPSMRSDTIRSWINKIVQYIDAESSLEEKIYNWMKDVKPQLKRTHLISDFKDELEKAFQNNIRIMLIIDELTGEQRETIKNVINSFKLESNKKTPSSVDFSGYVVRLEHMLNCDDKSKSRYALSIQDNW